MPLLTRLIPDLGDELCLALDGAWELLLSVAVCERDTGARMELPTPLAQRVGLDALRRVKAAVEQTQSRAGSTVPGAGRLLAPSARYEHRPLRLVPLETADLAVLAETAAVLGRELVARSDSELAHALAALAGDDECDCDCVEPLWTLAQLVEAFARAHGLLDLAATQDSARLAALLAGAENVDRGGDVVLSGAAESAYRRTADRFNAVWAEGNELDRLLY